MKANITIVPKEGGKGKALKITLCATKEEELPEAREVVLALIALGVQSHSDVFAINRVGATLANIEEAIGQVEPGQIFNIEILIAAELPALAR